MRREVGNRGFTLIELMVVVIIIAALAGMVLPRLLPVSDEAKRNIAKGDIANISVAVKLYRLRNDRFPTTEEGLKILYPEYLEKRAKDPWKEDYEYRSPGTHSPGGFDLWSKGPNKQSGDADDVANWEE
jgi:general secretion pathway protein G